MKRDDRELSSRREISSEGGGVANKEASRSNPTDSTLVRETKLLLLLA